MPFLLSSRISASRPDTSAFSTAVTNASSPKGFGSQPTLPNSIFLSESLKGSAVVTTTGMSRRATSLFCSRRNVQPSMRGILRSNKIIEGRKPPRSKSSASRPSAATTGQNPLSSRTSTIDIWRSASSSTVITIGDRSRVFGEVTRRRDGGLPVVGTAALIEFFTQSWGRCVGSAMDIRPQEAACWRLVRAAS